MDLEKDSWPRYRTAVIDNFTRALEELALKIARTAEENDKRYTLSGGWAIEFSRGEISRNHHDIDFHPVSADLQWWINWFNNLGYRVQASPHDGPEKVYQVRDDDGVLLVDLCPLDAKGLKELSPREVIYKNTAVHIKDPARVLEYKIEFAQKHRGGKLRIQDLHDFKILGKTPPQE